LGTTKDDILGTIINHVTVVTEEYYVPSKNMIVTAAFAHFGLSDAVLAEIASRHLLVIDGGR